MSRLCNSDKFFSTSWHLDSAAKCTAAVCCTHSVQSAVSKQIPFQISPQQSVSQCQCRLHLAAIQLRHSVSVRMLGHCSSFDHDRAHFIMSGSVSLRCLQARPLAGPLYSLCSQNNCQRFFCSYCPCFQKARSFNFVLSLWWFLFSFQKTNYSDPRCLKVETPLVPGSKQLLHRSCGTLCK